MLFLLFRGCISLDPVLIISSWPSLNMTPCHDNVSGLDKSDRLSWYVVLYGYLGQVIVSVQHF
jgi:hypothetical protein